MNRSSELKKELKKLSDPKQAKILQGFFKTGEGEYGEGDIFLGIKVPFQRDVAKRYQKLDLSDLQKLLNSKIHEHRMVALIILVSQYIKGDEQKKKRIYEFYLNNTRNINNWDLVDISAPKIVGDYLLDRSKDILYRFAKSKNMWERRIVIISTAAFITKDRFSDVLKISKILISDEHDLIHKAVGWMLREVGKKDRKVEERFLNKYYQKMPRVMLRYAIEKFSKEKRSFYMQKNV